MDKFLYMADWKLGKQFENHGTRPDNRGTKEHCIGKF